MARLDTLKQRTGPTDLHPPPGEESAVHDEIAERAYELYLARGSEEGHALDHWLEAERMLSNRRPAGYKSRVGTN
jgi:hypothetical protein